MYMKQGTFSPFHLASSPFFTSSSPLPRYFPSPPFSHLSIIFTSIAIIIIITTIILIQRHRLLRIVLSLDNTTRYNPGTAIHASLVRRSSLAQPPSPSPPTSSSVTATSANPPLTSMSSILGASTSFSSRFADTSRPPCNTKWRHAGHNTTALCLGT
ncbi:hypothetical protein M419DRAFT_38306 [Trichoderma reesei RUT C-30]|uniref:Uncharacterized protein n=1 Tax=Hypocrea jecorina (strain ATCC 56765 / BCRC 32924 / NRRL 11460 / Rut C-30) TaxID=1344414 RepID=A0A024S269_HYPJR|nr:hypothetical protein M419DRAFT_38306 [Trichoderma reesei RUT C-30]